MKKRFLVIEIISILILCIATIWYLGIVLRPADVGVAMEAIDTFHEYPEQSLDVIVYGSSHPWKSVDTNQMYEEYGIEAYNYSCFWQQLNTTKLFLEDSLRSQSPKLALIETYRVDDVIYDADMDGEVYYTKAISDFEGRREYLKQCFQDNKLRYLSYYVPFVAFHENWMNIGIKDLVIKKANNMDYHNRGYRNSANVEKVVVDKSHLSTQQELPEASVKILDDIMSICNDHNIKVIFFVAPFAEEDYCYGKAMKRYAAENNSVYIDFFDIMDEIGISEETDFADIGHLNLSGANKVTKYLSEYILDNYETVN